MCSSLTTCTVGQDQRKYSTQLKYCLQVIWTHQLLIATPLAMWRIHHLLATPLTMWRTHHMLATPLAMWRTHHLLATPLTMWRTHHLLATPLTMWRTHHLLATPLTMWKLLTTPLTHPPSAVIMTSTQNLIVHNLLFFSCLIKFWGGSCVWW